MPSGGKELYRTQWRKLFDAGLVALEIISPGKDTNYGILRCCTLPSRENFPRQWPAPWLLRQIFRLPVLCRTFLLTKGHDHNFLLSLWIQFASSQNSITPRLWKHLYSYDYSYSTQLSTAQYRFSPWRWRNLFRLHLAARKHVRTC